MKSVIQMDPEDSVTHTFEEDNLIRRELVRLAVPPDSIPFDTVEMYTSL